MKTITTIIAATLLMLTSCSKKKQIEPEKVTQTTTIDTTKNTYGVTLTTIGDTTWVKGTINGTIMQINGYDKNDPNQLVYYNNTKVTITSSSNIISVVKGDIVTYYNYGFDSYTFVNQYTNIKNEGYIDCSITVNFNNIAKIWKCYCDAKHVVVFQ